MSNENIYSKLTPSAKDALDKLSEEYKEMLLEKASQIAGSVDTAGQEISLRDILEAQKASSQFSYMDKTIYKKKRLLLLISLSGAVYASLGLLIYLFHNSNFSIENDIGSVIVIIGMSFVLLVYFYYDLKYHLKANDKDYDIVKGWQIIEELAKKNMSSTGENDLASSSVSFLIRFLSHKIAKNEDEFLKIRNLLQARNKIVHEGYHMNEPERNELIKFSYELIRRLETTQAQIGISTNHLEIIKAIYGTSKNSFEATKELNQLINNNKLEFVLNNEIIGDPDPGTIKQLIITYKIGDKIKTETYEEGSKVIIQ